MLPPPSHVDLMDEVGERLLGRCRSARVRDRARGQQRRPAFFDCPVNAALGKLRTQSRHGGHGMGYVAHGAETNDQYADRYFDRKFTIYFFIPLPGPYSGLCHLYMSSMASYLAV